MLIKWAQLRITSPRPASLFLLIASPDHPLTLPYRVRTLTGKEIELDIEPDYKVSYLPVQQKSQSKSPWNPPDIPPSSHRRITPIMIIPSHTPPPYLQQALSTHQIWYEQVARIKERVEEKEGIPPVQQRLIFGGKQMYPPSSPSPPIHENQSSDSNYKLCLRYI